MSGYTAWLTSDPLSTRVFPFVSALFAAECWADDEQRYEGAHCRLESFDITVRDTDGALTGWTVTRVATLDGPEFVAVRQEAL